MLRMKRWGPAGGDGPNPGRRTCLSSLAELRRARCANCLRARRAHREARRFRPTPRLRGPCRGSGRRTATGRRLAPAASQSLEREPEGQVAGYGVDARTGRGGVEHAPDVVAGAPPVALVLAAARSQAAGPAGAALPGAMGGSALEPASTRERVHASLHIDELGPRRAPSPWTSALALVAYCLPRYTRRAKRVRNLMLYWMRISTALF